MKKLFLLFLIPCCLFLIIGCGSDDSDKLYRIEPVHMIDTFPAPSAYVEEPTYLGMKPEAFVKAYNDKVGSSAVKIVDTEYGDGVCIFKTEHPNYTIGGQTSQLGYLGTINLLGPAGRDVLGVIYIVAQVVEKATGVTPDTVIANIQNGIFEQNGFIFALQQQGSDLMFVITDRRLSNDAENTRRIKEEQKRVDEAHRRNEEQHSANLRTNYIAHYNLGGLGIGSSLDQMHQKLGKEKNIRPSEKIEGVTYYEYEDIVVGIKDDRVVRVATYTDKPQTEKGIRQGDSLEKVLSTYGRTCSVTKHIDSHASLPVYEYPSEFQSAGSREGLGEYEVLRFAVNKDNVVEYISLRHARSDEEIKSIFNLMKTL